MHESVKGGKALCRVAMLTRAVWQVGRLSLGLRQRKASGGQKRPGSRSSGRAAGLDLQTADIAHGQCLEGTALGQCGEFQSL